MAAESDYTEAIRIVSPSVLYAGHDFFAESTSLKDPVTGETLTAKLVIQLYVKPGSYQVRPQTIGAISEVDPHIGNQELEWYINEAHCTLLYGLLIKLDDAHIRQAVSKDHSKCEYKEKCRRFKELLQLADAFFDSTNDKCFCTKCHVDRGDELSYQRGKPAKDYWLPIGWCRIGFKMGTREEVLKLRNKWHIAFYGTRMQNIKTIMEATGALKIAGYRKTIVSPSIRYAGDDYFAESRSFQDPLTGETSKVKVVIQLFIKPGSCQVGPPTVGAVSEIDPNISNQELEWSIIEPDSVLLYGILIKVDKGPDEAGYKGFIDKVLKGTADSNDVVSCEYQEKCQRFKELLHLSDALFDSSNDKCFCTKCHGARGDELSYKRGEPSMDYWLPIGWCRIGLRMVNGENVSKMRKKWHIAFHGTKVQDIKPFLEGFAPFVPVKTDVRARVRCEYQQKCRRFKDSRQLSDDFFDSKNDRCFCMDCHEARGDKLYYKRGKPAKDYGLPIGWCRVGFKMEPRANALQVKNEWHVAFHGTRVDSVKSILECGDLLMPGDVALGGRKLREEKGHFHDDWKPAEFNTKQIFVSPSVHYAGQESYAESKRFQDPVTGESFNAKVVFQLYIKPDSYQVGPQTIGATTEIDAKISNQEIEWSTKQRGATVFYGLLVKLDKTG